MVINWGNCLLPLLKLAAAAVKKNLMLEFTLSFLELVIEKLKKKKSETHDI